jgi:hypothetical protein
MRAAIEAVRETARALRVMETNHAQIGNLDGDSDARDCCILAEKLEAALVELGSLYALGLMVEEMGEASAMIGKALRFGLDTPGPQAEPYCGRTARDGLELELGDVAASHRWADLDGVIRLGAVDDRRDSKLRKLTISGQTDNLGRPLAPPVRGRQVAVEVREDEAVTVSVACPPPDAEPECDHFGAVQLRSDRYSFRCLRCDKWGRRDPESRRLVWEFPDAQD